MAPANRAQLSGIHPPDGPFPSLAIVLNGPFDYLCDDQCGRSKFLHQTSTKKGVKTKATIMKLNKLTAMTAMGACILSLASPLAVSGRDGSDNQQRAELSIRETGTSVFFNTSGFATFSAVAVDFPGAEAYAISGQLSPRSIPALLVDGGGAAWLSEPRDPTAPSDFFSILWLADGSFFGFFVSANDPLVFGVAIDPSWVSFRETGEPVAIRVVGNDEFTGLGTGAALPFRLSITSGTRTRTR